MKSVTKFAYMSMLVAACLFCGCSRGNKGDAGKSAAAAKAYKPLVGADAFAVAVADYGKMDGDPLLRAFNDLAVPLRRRRKPPAWARRTRTGSGRSLRWLPP